MVRQFALAVIALGGVSAPALGVSPHIASNSSGYSIGISGFVPVICRATVDATMITPAAGEVRVGTLNEFCNSPNGYDVHADYSSSLAKATLLVDGKKINLSSSGTARISTSSNADIRQSEIFLDLPKGVESGNVSFRIVPR